MYNMPTDISELAEKANGSENLQTTIEKHLEAHPEQAFTNTELAENLGSSRQVISNVTKEMRREGVIGHVRVGRAFHYFAPKPENLELIEQALQNGDEETTDKTEGEGVSNIGS